MRIYLYLCDEGIVRPDYDRLIIISPNYVNTIDACEKSGVDYAIVEECWKTIKDIDDDQNYILDIERRLIKILSVELNKYHEKEYNSIEWNIVLNGWMNNYISSLWEKYSRIKKLLNLHVDHFYTTIYEPEHRPALDSFEFESWIKQNNAFQISQYLMLIKYLDADLDIRYIKETDNYVYDLIHPKITFSYCKVKIYRFFMRLLIFLRGKRIKTIACGSYLPFEFLLSTMRKSNFSFLNIEYDYLRNERLGILRPVDVEWRENPIKWYNCDEIHEFEKIVIKFVKQNLPLVYVEAFQYIQYCQQKWFGKLINTNKIIYSSGGVIVDEVFKNYLMSKKHVDSNVVFADVQHGGNYGIESNMIMKTEYEISDVFYSWGWNYKVDNCKIIPMPSAKLLALSVERKVNNNILYVSYSFFKNYTTMDYQIVFYKKNFENEIKYLNGLSERVKEKLVVRLAPNDNGWGIKKRIQNSVPGIRFDEISEYYERLSSVSLVICSAWNTTAIEALYADIPVVILKQLNEVTKESIIDVRNMKKYGILIETWDELLEFTNQMYDINKVNKWWNEPDRRNFINEIKKKLVYMPSDARNIWERELIGESKS